ncbi:MAG: four helix bundle protein [Bacteroidales bacterium]|nr:four helix bundle protein [Bacteroidales bacterium]
MPTWNSFEEIESWQLARKLANDVYNLFLTTPLGKDFGLRNQMNNSSGSIMDNIAEGFGRSGNKEFINFLGISKGSCLELKSQFYRCFDRNYITDKEFDDYVQRILELDGKIGGLMAYLKRSAFKGSKYK